MKMTRTWVLFSSDKEVDNYALPIICGNIDCSRAIKLKEVYPLNSDQRTFFERQRRVFFVGKNNRMFFYMRPCHPSSRSDSQEGSVRKMPKSCQRNWRHYQKCESICSLTQLDIINYLSYKNMCVRFCILPSMGEELSEWTAIGQETRAGGMQLQQSICRLWIAS